MKEKLNQVGTKYHHFVVTKYQPIDELQCTLYELLHEPTGASVMHLENDDTENLFCLSFQTLPTSSNGAPHILEHTVLCGSDKYPIKDPFSGMKRRSLNTFMNAMTGSDFTCYPASSKVEKDFYNLLEVYMDAVFHPELKKMSFMQEGHRLEFSKPNDPKSDLLFKGVVFNEMKGALNSADSRLWHAMLKHLLPDLPYCYNSGGDPKEIPTLSHEELKEFHAAFYHPSHCLFFFYGNIPLKKHLDFIEEHALKGVEKKELLNPIPSQKRFTSPQSYNEKYPIAKHESLKKKTLIGFGWLTCRGDNEKETLALSLLDSILTETDASPLKYALLKSNLCTQVDSLMDMEMSEIPWAIVFKGCEAVSKEKLKLLIHETLQKIINDRIPQELIEASLHQLEFSRSEIKGEDGPFGLTLFFRSALAKQHGSDPENALRIHSLFKELRKELKNTDYLPSLIRKYILDNPHLVEIVMEPDPDLAEKETRDEKETLKRIRNNLKEDEVKKIIQDTKALADYQKEIEHQSLDCLPKITLDDVPKTLEDFPLHEEKNGNLTLFHHDCFTNNILYADLVFDLPDIAKEDFFLLSLLASILSDVGCGKRNYQENLGFIQAHTGGVFSSISFHVQAKDSTICKPTLSIQGKALHRNASYLLTLFKEMSTSLDFSDKDRIKELLLQQYTYLENSLSRSAMSLAVDLSVSGNNLSSYLYNQFHGIPYLIELRKIVQNIDESLPKLMSSLERLSGSILALKNPNLVLSCSKDFYEFLKKEAFFGLSDIPCKPYTPWKGGYPIEKISSQGRIIASPVAFTSMAFQTIPYNHPQSSSLLVATSIMENTHLHQKIREEGGAYGTGASYSPTTGNFYLYTYRDPHLANSLLAFETSIEELGKGHFNDEDLTEAKLEIIQAIDSPIPPGKRAFTAYGWKRVGKTKEMRDAFRKKVLTAKKEEIVEAVKQHLLSQKDKGIIVSFADVDFLKKENELLKKSLPILQV